MLNLTRPYFIDKEHGRPTKTVPTTCFLTFCIDETLNQDLGYHGGESGVLSLLVFFALGVSRVVEALCNITELKVLNIGTLSMTVHLDWLARGAGWSLTVDP